MSSRIEKLREVRRRCDEEDQRCEDWGDPLGSASMQEAMSLLDQLIESEGVRAAKETALLTRYLEKRAEEYGGGKC